LAHSIIFASEVFKNIYFCCVPDFRHFIFYLCLILLAGAFPDMQAQKLEFEQLSIEQGLPSCEVYNLYQDKKGYIWACTEYGIVKHNGTRFIPVCKNIPFEESAFYVIRESAKGDLYLANSQANIYQVRNDSAFRVKGIEKISEKIMASKEVMFDMLIDEHSNIYFSTFNTSYFFSNADHKVISLSRKYANDSGNTCFKKVGKDYALIKTKSIVNSNHSYKVIDENDRLICQVPYMVYENDRNRLRKHGGSYFFTNSNKLISLNEYGLTQTLTLKDYIISLALSPDGEIWIGTNNGLYHVDINLKILAHYFNGRVVSDILFDHRNGMWVSTIERGVYYCRNRNNIYYYDIEALSSTISLLKKVNNRFFIGTSDGNLFEKKYKRLIKLNKGHHIHFITDIAYFNGMYIVAAKNKIMILDHDKSLAENESFFFYKGKPLTSYGFTYEKNALIFIYLKGIYKYNDNTTRMLASCIDRPVCIARRNNKEYLIGTKKGIFLLSDTSYYRPDFLSSLKNRVILKVLVDKNSNVWICTKGYGLHQLLPDNRLIEFRNIPSNVVNNINIIHDTTILLSTDKGLFINNLTSINQNSSWKLLVNNEATGAEIIDDHIFIATKQGLVTIKEKALFFTAPPLKFYLESIIANNRKIDLNNIQLSHNENNIYFNFDILAYETPGYTISYELDGPDSITGVSVGKPLYLHNLQPGHYTLTARPFYSGIHDQHAAIRIPFYVRPAFWQTKIFLITTVVLLIAIVLFILYHLRQKEKRKAEIARQLAEYRLTAIKAQINPHFISNSLTAIQQLMIRSETDKASQYIAKFSLLLRYVLKYSDKYVTHLSDEIKLIGTNVELEQLRFNNQFIFEKDINEDVFLDGIFVPPLITQPIIENAIWHGLLPLNNKRTPKLTLRVDIIHEKLIISIIDNGVGRQNIPSGTAQMNNKESRGTWLVKNWIENLNQLSAVKGTTVNYIDLFDEQNDPAGTQVDIIFPIEALNRLRNEKDTVRYY
jgi:ligand-binding sensor domain-containing protein